jgi:GT2 family glycosyltransferase
MTTKEKMKLSIIIVNYNVKFFLEQALTSVFNARQEISMEVFVVDNNSQDDSVAMVKQKFPQVHLIENKDNPGFSKANNQAIRRAKGEYILLLNPDTVLEEDTLTKCIEFMNAHPEAGAMGVKMIDGAGLYLQESKRGLPTPWVSFFKITGLTSLFPRSSLFNRYYLGHLSEEETHSIEVLPGAFMFIRKTTLDRVGGLDERFFMYGEDIDLSYRILQDGAKIYYTPLTKIIHYKGESTRKGSLNYVKIFHEAMILFADKHFAGSQNKVFILLIKLAVYFKALHSALYRVLSKILLPLLEFLLIGSSLSLSALAWAKYYHNDLSYYDGKIYFFVLPTYAALYILSLLFFGAYDNIYRKSRQIGALLTGFLLIAIGYSFLPEDLRSSRMIVLLSVIWSLVIVSLLRWLWSIAQREPLASRTLRKTAIVGSEEEFQRIQKLIQNIGVSMEILGRIQPPGERESKLVLGKTEDLEEIIRLRKIDQIIFCGKDISSEETMHWMTRLSRKVDFKIAPKDMDSIIGSKSRNTAGELYTVQVSYQIDDPMNKRLKRTLELLLCLFLLLSSLLTLWFFQHKKRLLANVFQVLLSQCAWVGYDPRGNTAILPPLKPSVLHASSFYQRENNPDQLSKLNFLYARDYSILTDLYILLNSFSKLDQPWK